MDKMKVVKIGRPSGYSVDVADTICQEIMTGKSLREICAREDMPGASTVYSWLREHPEFQEAYVQAREVQADVLADEIIEIADTEPDPNRARVMIDARKWLASKLRPKKYGDRVELDHRGGGGLPMQVTVSVVPCGSPESAIEAEVIKPALPS